MIAVGGFKVFPSQVEAVLLDAVLPTAERIGAALFVQSLRGLSHTNAEDTNPEDIEMAVRALDRLAAKTTDWLAART